MPRYLQILTYQSHVPWKNDLNWMAKKDFFVVLIFFKKVNHFDPEVTYRNAPISSTSTSYSDVCFDANKVLADRKKNIYDISNISYVDCRGIWPKIRRFNFWLCRTTPPPPLEMICSLFTFDVINWTDIPVYHKQKSTTNNIYKQQQ